MNIYSPHAPNDPRLIQAAISRFAAEMRSLGISCTWTRLYNATKPTIMIALENVNPDVFILEEPPPDKEPE